MHYAPEEERPLLDVWFRDERTGFAVGAYGYFLATGDGGDTWTSRAVSEDDFHLNALAPAGPDRLFIAAEAGVAYRSDDGGETWRALSPPYGGSWFGVLALDADRVLLLGLRGHLLRSEDAGESWTQVVTATNATLTGALRVDSGQVLITGLEGDPPHQPGRRAQRVARADRVAPGDLGRARARRRRRAAARRVRRPAPARDRVAPGDARLNHFIQPTCA